MWKIITRFFALKIFSPFHWTGLKFLFTGRAYDISAEQREAARDLMSAGVYLWVSRRETHFTTYAIAICHWVLGFLVWAKNKFKGNRPRFSFYSHAFFNFDDNELIEAVGTGVRKAYFDHCFDVDAVAALAPKNLTKEEWDAYRPLIIEGMKSNLGKGYDTSFDLTDENAVSCIELIRIVLKNTVKEYELKFSDFENMIKLYKNLTPQMIYDSSDFVVVWEAGQK
jgi:hypothetical protein